MSPLLICSTATQTLRCWSLNFPSVILGLLVFSGAALAQQRHYSATNLWHVPVGSNFRSTPALGTNGDIYVIAGSGELCAVRSDGVARWVFAFHSDTASSPAVGADGSIYFGSRDRRLYAVSVEGQKRWEFPTGGWVDASPAIGTNGAVYFGSFDKVFYALASSGEKQWEFQTRGPIVSSAAIDVSGSIYFGSNDRRFYALNPDGTKRWEFVTGGAIISSPAIGPAGEIYFSSTDGKLYALNPDGSRRWALQTGGVSSSSPVLDAEGMVYLSVNTSHCAVSASGQLLWRWGFWNLSREDLFGETTASVLADRSVVFTGGDGYVMTLPPDSDGREWLWNYWLYAPSYSSPLVGPDGVVYVLSASQGLTALQRNVPLAKSSWPTARGNSQRTGRVATGH